MKPKIEVTTKKFIKAKHYISKCHFINKSFFLVFALFLFCSHDLYIKMETYFLKPNQEASLSLYNGTFEKSENIITRDRMLDASLITHGKRVAIAQEQWTDKDSIITQLSFNTGSAGTYVVGVSTKARNITLNAEKFNNYLTHDGVLDMLEQRTKDGLLNQDAVESYQKHVKAIYQVGDIKTNDWNTVLNYPIEFIPQANPYETYSGEKLSVQLLLAGKPLPNQLVYADYLKSAHSHKSDSHDHDHSHDHTHQEDAHNTHSHSKEEKNAHSHTEGQQLRTDEQGIVIVDLPEDGIYFLRSIYMTKVTDSDKLTHQSKWATLTFEVSHKHDTSTHTHDHESGLSIWVFIIGSLLIIGLLFFVFRKNN